MQFLIITSCTRRKRTGLTSPLNANQLTSGRHIDLVNQWIALANNTKEKVAADHLYIGRAINEVKASAKFLNAKISFASTGFGLIDAKTELPNYDLTVAGPTDPIRSKVINCWRAFKIDQVCALNFDQANLGCRLLHRCG